MWDESVVVRATLWAMTTREIAKRLIDELPESEVEPVVEFIASRQEGKRVVDEWGDLSKVHDVAFGESMRRLSERERAAGHEPW